MAQSLEEVLAAALALSEPDRAELAGLLEASLEAPPGARHPAWPQELRRRDEQLQSGEVRPVSWDEVRRKLQARLDAPE
jgi:putative addiction module component (TIGR02574 family)